MEDYKSMCKQIRDKVKQITEGRGFFARYELTIDEPIRGGAHEVTTVNLIVDFFDDVFKVAEKLRELLDKEEARKNEPVERKDACSIKDARDEALLYLYNRYNSLAALGEDDFAAPLSMCDLLGAIEKLEHARHMEMSDEIAKLSIEKLEKLASPMPTIKMSGIPKEFRDDLRKCGKKEGSEDDD